MPEYFIFTYTSEKHTLMSVACLKNFTTIILQLSAFVADYHQPKNTGERYSSLSKNHPVKSCKK